ncbi:amidase [Conexibacter sp. SYSU D00693]|uniref:amidase n=1 Tax=Conexibacter sp. SYSU D00693 TaxID=2812560 RepID=UPI00196B9BC1|nr:amidase [Conexibacter sp. SYSU D00693]
MEELLTRPVDELARLVRSGEVRARELVQASLDRIEAVDGQIGAFVDVLGDKALAAADEVQPGDPRPLAGVPVAIKNNRALAGERLTLCADFMGDFVAPYDHNVVRRLKEAGAIVVGTTRLPEWGIAPTTETRRFGQTHNPYDLSRTPGGSSGGSGAAVAAGMVPFAHANDGGGSTRIPAACNGLVGLKPQRGRISQAPEVGHQFLVQDGVLTRTVAETALCLDLLAGYEVGDMAWAPPPAEPFSTAAAREPGRLRIAVSTRTPLPDTPVHPSSEQAVRDAAALLESLGHEVVEADPPWRQDGLLHKFTALFGPAVCTQIALASMLAGREPAEEDMEPMSWAIWQLCKSIDATSALGAEYQLHGFARAFLTWLADFDVLLTPALAEPPVELGLLDPEGPDPMGVFARGGRFTPYTAIFNVTGSPAISVPLFEHDGLPLAVQLAGQPAQEGALLALAAQLEAAQPWADRRPAL